MLTRNTLTILLFFTSQGINGDRKGGKSHCPDNGRDKLDVSSSLIPVSKNVTSFFLSHIVNQFVLLHLQVLIGPHVFVIRHVINEIYDCEGKKLGAQIA